MAALYEIKQIITDLALAYPDWKPRDMAGTIKQYEESLKGFPVDLLQRATNRCRDSCVFFPKISEIRRAISEMTSSVSSSPGGVWPEAVRTGPISPEIEKYLADFRHKMVSQGKWKESRTLA
jgi:hypothetical protein